MILAVNGTLMRGYAANHFLIDAGAIFLRDARTAPIYRLWTVGDRHPAMLRDERGGASIRLELWQITPENVIAVFETEPPGLVIGKILLDDGSTVAGILAEPYLVAGYEEITHYHGWREYQNAKNLS
jgi:hypothetical protein